MSYQASSGLKLQIQILGPLQHWQSRWLRSPISWLHRNIPAICKYHNYNIFSSQSTTLPRLPQRSEIFWVWLLNRFITKKMLFLNSGCFYVCDLRVTDISHLVGNSKDILYKGHPPIYHRFGYSGELWHDFIFCLLWISSHNHSDMVNDIISDMVSILRRDKPVSTHINLGN